MEDFRKLVKLGQMSRWLHHSGGTVCEPTDLPVNKRHLDMLLAHMTLSDKPFMGSVTEPERARRTASTMAEILFGKEVVQDNTVMISLINVNSPLTFDATMMGALEVYAAAGSGLHHLALHRRRRDGAGLGRGHADAGPRRGDGGGRLLAARSGPARR